MRQTETGHSLLRLQSKEKGQAIIEPTLDEELKRFKAICRSITRHELDQTQSSWFDMERKARLRRLGGLAVVGNQPALQVHVKASVEEKAIIARSIMQQKIGSNPQTMKKYEELKARRKEHDDEGGERGRCEESQSILLKFARIAVECKVRWTRTLRPRREDEAPNDLQEGEHDKSTMPYSSRMIACNRCGLQQETKKMQLRTAEGYRAIHCKGCGKQERTSRNHCQCKVIWHQCDTHRVDPEVHASRKGLKDPMKGASVDTKLSSTRKAPRTRNSGWLKPITGRTKKGRSSKQMSVCDERSSALREALGQVQGPNQPPRQACANATGRK